MVYVTSDLHGAFDIRKINPRESEVAQKMQAGDYLIVCGDFGCVWDGASNDNFWLNWLESLPWTTLFIDGNHENFSILNAYPQEEWNGGKIHRIRSNVIHLMRGEIFHFDNKTWLALGGGYSHDHAFRSEGVNWWKQEIMNQEEAQHALDNLAKAGWKVDVILSHDVYASHPLANTYELELERYEADQVQQLEFLEEIRKKTDYKIWLCGHYHKDLLTFTDGRPCRMLFDDVRTIDELLEESQKAASDKEAECPSESVKPAVSKGSALASC